MPSPVSPSAPTIYFFIYFFKNILFWLIFFTVFVDEEIGVVPMKEVEDINSLAHSKREGGEYLTSMTSH